MPKLIIDNNKRCHLDDENDVDFLRELDTELSFNVQGAQYTAAFKHGWMDPFEGKFVRWDGTQRFLEETNLSFPIGLRRRVEEFYAGKARDLEISDLRPQKTISDWDQYQYPDVIARLQEWGKIPYPHQLETLNVVKQHDHGIIRIGTGGGKTICAALIVANRCKKSIIYVVGKDLLYQIYKLFCALFDQDKTEIGIVGDGQCKIGDINIVSVWTAGCALGMKKGNVLFESDGDEAPVEPAKYVAIRQMMKDAKLHLLDECHVAACQTIQELSRHINPEFLYGMSASPWRDDGADLMIESILGNRIIDISASTLIKQGLLVKPIIKFKRVPGTKVGTNYQSIYKNYIVENDIRNKMVTDSAENLVKKGYKTLVLYNSLKHGKILEKQISQRIPCKLLSGKDPTSVREYAREDLLNNKINCIIASRIFDLGVDIPELSGLIVAGSGKSSVRALQRIGRVIRSNPGKKVAAVIDFVDDAKYLKDHAQSRKRIYSSEEEFDIRWPTK